MSRPNNDRLNTTLTARGSLAYSDRIFFPPVVNKNIWSDRENGIMVKGKLLTSMVNALYYRAVIILFRTFPSQLTKVELLNDKTVRQL